ncbi:MAG: mycofactocin biosynthesis peptidyl-dipeptidase MftE, partial [Mycobacterium sp.]
LVVLGDPTTATAAEGERILAEMVDACLSRVGRWAPAADGMLT